MYPLTRSINSAYFRTKPINISKIPVGCLLTILDENFEPTPWEVDSKCNVVHGSIADLVNTPSASDYTDTVVSDAVASFITFQSITAISQSVEVEKLRLTPHGKFSLCLGYDLAKVKHLCIDNKWTEPLMEGFSELESVVVVGPRTKPLDLTGLKTKTLTLVNMGNCLDSVKDALNCEFSNLHLKDMTLTEDVVELLSDREIDAFECCNCGGRGSIDGTAAVQAAFLINTCLRSCNLVADGSAIFQLLQQTTTLNKKRIKARTLYTQEITDELVDYFDINTLERVVVRNPTAAVEDLSKKYPHIEVITEDSWSYTLKGKEHSSCDPEKLKDMHVGNPKRIKAGNSYLLHAEGKQDFYLFCHKVDEENHYPYELSPYETEYDTTSSEESESDEVGELCKCACNSESYSESSSEDDYPPKRTKKVKSTRPNKSKHMAK